MKKIVLLFIATLFLVTSCDDGFEELNTNPLSPTDVSDGALFNQIVSSLQLGWNRQLFLHNEVLYDVTEQAAVTAKTFGNITGGSEEIWTNYYAALKNANELKNRFESNTEDEEINDILSAQLDILMAYKTFQLTDLFGDIPYSEAGRVFDEDVVIRPKYDSQEEIYKSLIAQLENASTLLGNGGQTSSGNNYLRYGLSETLLNDNLDHWIRFSNSLQLRHLVRMFEKEPEFVSPRVKELLESGANIITKGLDVVMSPRDQSWSNLGVNWSFREHNKVRLGSTLYNYMTEDDEIIDPRLTIFFEPNNNEEWVAFPQVPNSSTQQSGGEPYNKDRRDALYADKGADNIYSSVNFYLVRDEKDIPEILMTSAEVKFLKSEIFLRGIGVTADAPRASQELIEGTLESLEYWNNLMMNSEAWINKPAVLTLAELFVTTQHPRYAFDTSASDEENLKKIYAQRWVDGFRQPWEAFSLLRRTNLLPREKPQNEFLRFKYPPSESALNADNYLEQTAAMGGDETNVKVWWIE